MEQQLEDESIRKIEEGGEPEDEIERWEEQQIEKQIEKEEDEWEEKQKKIKLIKENLISKP